MKGSANQTSSREEAGKLIKVADVVNIRELRDQGLSKQATAKRLNLHRDTVAKHWDGPATSPETPRYATRAKKIDPYHDYITKRLADYPELSAKRIFEELSDRGFPGSYRSVRRYVAILRPRYERLYTPIQTLPGEQAQVDWGHMGSTVIEGRRYKLYVFVFTLSWSRVSYVEFVVSLNTATFLASLQRALEYVGGVPQTILFDNAKTVVSERVGDAIRFNESLLRFALAAGFTPKACWMNDPESKGKVESAVKYVKRGFFYGLEWTGLDELNRQARRWCDEIANQRVHGTTHRIPWERLVEEQPYLKAVRADLPVSVPETRRVSKDRQITIDGNRYFIQVARPKTRLAYQRYEDRIELTSDGKRHCIPLVYGYREPEVPQPMRRQTPSHPLQAQFEALAPNAALYLKGLSQSRAGHLREQMQSIIRLADSWPTDRLEAAMARAITYGSYGYSALAGIMKHQQLTGGKASGVRPQPVAAFKPQWPHIELEQRPLEYYRSAVGGSR